jgi:hypothetical protein
MDETKKEWVVKTLDDAGKLLAIIHNEFEDDSEIAGLLTKADACIWNVIYKVNCINGDVT